MNGPTQRYLTLTIVIGLGIYNGLQSIPPETRMWPWLIRQTGYYTFKPAFKEQQTDGSVPKDR